MAQAKSGHTWSPPHSQGQGTFCLAGLPTLLCAQAFPGSFSPFVSYHLAVSLRDWKVASSWHRLSTEICWPVCWAWLGGPQLSPASMVGEVPAAQRVVSQGWQMGSPQGEATWQDRVVVKRSSLGFISKMLLGWQEHLPPARVAARSTDGPGKAGAMGLLLELGTLSQTYPLYLGGLRENVGGMVIS